MKRKFRLREFMENGIDNILVILLIFMVAMVFINACLRYFFRTNIPNSEELARFSFVWMCFVGCVVVHMRKSHMCVTALTEYLPKKAVQFVNIIARFVTAGALLYLSYGSLLYIRQSSQFMNPGISVNFGIIVSVTLIATAGMLLVDIVDFVKFMVNLIKPGTIAIEAEIENTGEQS